MGVGGGVGWVGGWGVERRDKKLLRRFACREPTGTQHHVGIAALLFGSVRSSGRPLLSLRARCKKRESGSRFTGSRDSLHMSDARRQA